MLIKNIMFQSPGDIAFSIFGFPVYFYGITMALAIFAGVYTAYLFYKKFYSRKEAELIIDFSPYLIILGILGARMYYCLVNLSYYSLKPIEIFDIRQGGLSIHGMIIIGVLCLWIFSRVYRISFLKLFDVFMCGTALGQSIGRWGNFFNSEAFGYPTNLPWKLYIPPDNRPFHYINYEYFHPTFLYESILDFCVFIILFLMLKRFYNKPGLTACFYLILYSLVRIFVEQLRIDSVLSIDGIPVAQMASILLMFTGIVGAGLLIAKYMRN